MSTVANLLARKQVLLERLEIDPGPNEREEIERLLRRSRPRSACSGREIAALPGEE
jgi:hypothetical protein